MNDEENLTLHQKSISNSYYPVSLAPHCNIVFLLSHTSTCDTLQFFTWFNTAILVSSAIFAEDLIGNTKIYKNNSDAILSPLKGF